MSHTILHLSDLHRSAADPIGNDELLSTLIADRDQYVRESPSISRPEAIVVSGDLVQGVPLSCQDPEREIKEQYEVALDFLIRLTDQMLEGDRSRVVLVPGNHDVSWPTSFRAMDLVDEVSGRVDLAPLAFGPASDLRWDWGERRLLRITDRSLYESRFSGYAMATEQFYRDLPLNFESELDPYFRLFELFDGRVAVAAFNSCNGNDCFSFHGSIPESSIALAHLAFKKNEPRYDLLMAVWHHNVEGAPYSNDYMDVDAVYRLISKGFRLGLHGHQHRAEIDTRYIQLADSLPMAIVSAGSLCAGRRDLPVGVNRQYNVIELADDFTGARVHVREMAVATVFAPSRRPEFGGKSFVDLEWGGNADRSDVSRSARNDSEVISAEREFGSGMFFEAATRLLSLDLTPHSYQRSLLIRSLNDGELWDLGIERLGDPANSDEVMFLVRAHVESARGFDEAEEVLAEWAPRVGMTAPVVDELHQWIKTKRSLSNG
jgi:hypothetical protein